MIKTKQIIFITINSIKQDKILSYIRQDKILSHIKRPIYWFSSLKPDEEKILISDNIFFVSNGQDIKVLSLITGKYEKNYLWFDIYQIIPNNSDSMKFVIIKLILFI